jgi:predicted nucleic acid-binding protein
MVVAADTSFLFSLYGNDCNTSQAVAWCRDRSLAITIGPLNRFELINSLRFAECRHVLRPGEATANQLLFEQAIREGRLVERKCNLADILADAFQLSAAHTLTGGHRGFDILHVAAARIMGATHFLTFDGNQRRLAAAVGLDLPL